MRFNYAEIGCRFDHGWDRLSARASATSRVSVALGSGASSGRTAGKCDRWGANATEATAAASSRALLECDDRSLACVPHPRCSLEACDTKCNRAAKRGAWRPEPGRDTPGIFGGNRSRVLPETGKNAHRGSCRTTTRHPISSCKRSAQAPRSGLRRESADHPRCAA